LSIIKTQEKNAGGCKVLNGITDIVGCNFIENIAVSLQNDIL
jgi:hypothetical protein